MSGKNNPMYKHGRYSKTDCAEERVTVSDDEIRVTTASSTGFTEVAKKLGVGASTVTRRIKKMGLDISHFEWVRNRSMTDRELLDNGTKRISSQRIIAALIRVRNMSELSCSECGLGTMWGGSHLRLHLHHTNGDATDNRIENLVILCPNCHSQTDTFTGKNINGRIYM